MALTLPLEILAPVALGGVAAVVALAHLLGRTARPRIEDPAARWRELHEGDEVRDSVVTDDARVGLVLTEDERLGLLVAMGGRIADRILEPALVRDLRERGDTLELRLRDPGFSRVRLSLSAPDRSRWQDRLQRLLRRV